MDNKKKATLIFAAVAKIDELGIQFENGTLTEEDFTSQVCTVMKDAGFVIAKGYLG